MNKLNSKVEVRRNSRLAQRHILEAVVLLSSDMEDGEVVAQLICDGCTEVQAWKLVDVVPMGFARAVFQPAGVGFYDHYLVKKAGVPAATRCAVARDPVYRQAVVFAQRLATAQRVQALFHVVRRGADYAAIQTLHKKGVPLRDIQLKEPEIVRVAG